MTLRFELYIDNNKEIHGGVVADGLITSALSMTAYVVQRLGIARVDRMGNIFG